MKKVISWVLILICAFVTFVGYQNSQPDPAVQAKAASVACGSNDACKISTERIVNGVYRRETSITGQTYGFDTTLGNIDVTCKREHMFLGEWSCEVVAGGVR